MSQRDRDAVAFGASAVVLAVAAYLGSLPLLILAGVAAWVVMARLLPRGGLLAALAVALLWSNAAVVTTARIGAPAILALAPQALFAVVVIGRVYVHQRALVATPGFRALLVHAAAVTISVVGAIDHGPVLDSTQTFLMEGPILWFVVINAIPDRRALERCLTALVVAAGFLGLLSVVQSSTGSTDPYLGFAQIEADRVEAIETGTARTPRLAGSIGEKNRYAQSLLVVVPIAVALAQRRGSGRVAVPLGAAAMCIAGIALTASRGAAVGMVGVLVLLLLFRVVGTRSLGVVVAAAAVTLILLPGYRDRLLELAEASRSEDTAELDGSTQSRITQNLAAYNIYLDHPIAGVGPGGYQFQYEPYAERIGLNVRDATRQPHNLYLGIAAETGTLGLATFLAVIATVLHRLFQGWRRARERDPDLADLAAGCIVAISAYLMTGVFLHLSYERYLWLLLALADVTARIVRSENRAARGAIEPAPEPEPTAVAVGSSRRPLRDRDLG